jgi:hypothetical protein
VKTKKKTKLSASVTAKARKVLEFAQQRAKVVKNQMELSNELYTPNGFVSRTFPTDDERHAFFKTKEYKQIVKIVVSMPPPPLLDEVYEIRIPPSENGKKKR